MSRNSTQLTSDNMSLGEPIQNSSGVGPESEASISQGHPVPSDGGLIRGGTHGGTTADLVADNNNGHAAPKGKERATVHVDEWNWSPTGPCYLSTLPPELIDYVLSFLSPVDLAAVSSTCRDLYRLATTDHLWLPLVQANVPGIVLSSPSPCASFRDLYAAHDLRWFLPKHKLWFCDRDLTGKLIVTRYDPRTGNIEGYQLLAISNRTTFHHWQMDDDVIIHSFEPQLKLHIDRPVLRFEPARSEREREQDHSGITITRIPVRNGIVSNPTEQPSRSNDVADLSSRVTETNRFRAEMPLMLDSGYPMISSDFMCSNFMLARSLSPDAASRRLRPGFPYGNIWPPPVVPAHRRVAGARVHSLDMSPLSDEDIPSCRAETSDQAFRIRTWLEMRSGASRRRFRASNEDATRAAVVEETTGINIMELLFENMAHQPREPRRNPPSSMGLHIGEEISTYATLDPELYTPTARYPYRGIWVGDYSGHGCEFLLVHQPERDDDDFDLDIMPRQEGETDEDYAQRKIDETVYRGRLEAIKLTGDPNVPRGEYTFIVEDLGPAGFVRTIQEAPFHGARVVKSKGHVAGTGFVNDKYIESQLILTSHDRLAQYWVGFGHISFFERVNIDDFIKV
ncbi:hypothetical protein CONLIGDRAFT_462511 [Coniochaeta ligniaria NRRL 30616]|uniref:F-box domain-containing protein n=1 Tax=Coniochaeta ligniaria NRRL 30616 TaxID=1408157 RepID=A0A1J7J491_9PEZI|nr:hypothetical protein CONLIGDRAFT_462511 [Coniochaeta ligniaria NRRL 30616]